MKTKKTKRMITKRKMGIVLLVGLCLFIWVRNIFAEPEIQSSGSGDVDYDLVRLRAPDKSKVGERIDIKIEFQNRGSIDPGAALTVFGMQGDTVIPIENGLMVFDKPDGKNTEIRFSYTPVSGGNIQWQATLNDGNPDVDTASFTTKVAAQKNENKNGDEHDGKDDGGDGTSTSENIIAQHNRTSPQYNKNCTACHSKVLTEQSLDPSIRTTHAAMLPQTPGEKDEQKCLWCHKTVDLVQKSTGNLRRHVDVTLCSICHGSFGVEKQFYQAGLSPDNPDGPLLYDLVCAGCHLDLTNSKVKGESANEIQQKISKNEGGMGPLNFLSAAEIQAIADALVK